MNYSRDFTPASAYLSLGSNLGESARRLREARNAVSAFAGVRIAAASSVYRTEPQGFRDQPFFMNQVLGLDIDESGPGPLELLDLLLESETALGRQRDKNRRFGPRAIDLDLLLYGNEIVDTKRLTLPHPRMLERAFVLIPLSEIAPDLFLPQGLSLREALRRIDFRISGDLIFQKET